MFPHSMVRLSIAAISVTCAWTCAPAERPGREFGLVRNLENDALYLTARPGLVPGDRAYVLGSGQELEVVRLVDPSERIHIASFLYDVYVTVGIRGLDGGNAVYLVNGVKEAAYWRAPAVLFDAGASEDPGLRYTSCTRRESVRHAVVEDTPRGAVEIWSAGEYLGYDVDPTCPDIEVRK